MRRSLLYELRSELKYVPEEPALDVSLRSSTRSRLVVEAGVRGRGGRVGRVVEAIASASGIGDLPVNFVGGSIPQTSVYSFAHVTTCGCSLIPNLLSAWVQRHPSIQTLRPAADELTKMIATTTGMSEDQSVSHRHSELKGIHTQDTVL